MATTNCNGHMSQDFQQVDKIVSSTTNRKEFFFQAKSTMSGDLTAYSSIWATLKLLYLYQYGGT